MTRDPRARETDRRTEEERRRRRKKRATKQQEEEKIERKDNERETSFFNPLWRGLYTYDAISMADRASLLNTFPTKDKMAAAAKVYIIYICKCNESVQNVSIRSARETLRAIWRNYTVVWVSLDVFLILSGKQCAIKVNETVGVFGIIVRMTLIQSWHCYTSI